MANAYGARWFDMDWQPQFDSHAWAEVFTDYVSLLSEYGPPDAIANGFAETLELFQSGKCALWIDATVAASFVTNPKESRVADPEIPTVDKVPYNGIQYVDIPESQALAPRPASGSRKP